MKLSHTNNHIVGNKAKGRISKRVFQDSKARQNFRKTNISYPDKFFENFGVLCFLETLVLRFALCLITDEILTEIKPKCTMFGKIILP